MSTTIKVQMLAFQTEDGEAPVIREVVLTDEVWMALPITVENRLERIFHWGQNDFQPIPERCSVSVGDIIEYPTPIDTHLYLVEALGFRRMHQDEYEHYVTVPRNDRHFYAMDKSKYELLRSNRS